VLQIFLCPALPGTLRTHGQRGFTMHCAEPCKTMRRLVFLRQIGLHRQLVYQCLVHCQHLATSHWYTHSTPPTQRYTLGSVPVRTGWTAQSGRWRGGSPTPQYRRSSRSGPGSPREAPPLLPPPLPLPPPHPWPPWVPPGVGPLRPRRLLGRTAGTPSFSSRNRMASPRTSPL